MAVALYQSCNTADGPLAARPNGACGFARTLCCRSSTGNQPASNRRLDCEQTRKPETPSIRAEVPLETPDRRATLRARSCVRQGEVCELDAILRPAQGPSRSGRWLLSPLRGGADGQRRFAMIQQSALRAETAFAPDVLASAVDSSGDAIMVTDTEGRIRYVNLAFERITGYRAAEVVGENPRLLQSGEHPPGFYEALWRAVGAGESFREVFLDRAKDGRRFYIEQTISPIRDAHGDVSHYVAVGGDMTDRVEAERDLYRHATTDRLTGLANRFQLETTLERELARTERYGSSVGLAIIDLDHFKQVNDTHGHLVGDQVLAEVAERVARAVRRSDIVARWGGEEFVVLAPESDPRAAREMAEKLRRRIAGQPFAGVGRVTASVGVTASLAGEGVDALLGRADQALYRAKAEGRDRVRCARPGLAPCRPTPPTQPATSRRSSSRV